MASYLVRPETSDNDHLLEVSKLFRPRSWEGSTVRLFTVIDLTPLVCVAHKTLPKKLTHSLAHIILPTESL